MFNFCCDNQNAETLWPLLPLFCQLLTTGYNTTMPIQCERKLKADPIFSPVVDADPWSKSPNWGELKFQDPHISGACHQEHACRQTPTMLCLGSSCSGRHHLLCMY